MGELVNPSYTSHIHTTSHMYISTLFPLAITGDPYRTHPNLTWAHGKTSTWRNEQNIVSEAFYWAAGPRQSTSMELQPSAYKYRLSTLGAPQVFCFRTERFTKPRPFQTSHTIICRSATIVFPSVMAPSPTLGAGKLPCLFLAI